MQFEKLIRVPDKDIDMKDPSYRDLYIVNIIFRLYYMLRKVTDFTVGNGDQDIMDGLNDLNTSIDEYTDELKEANLSVCFETPTTIVPTTLSLNIHGVLSKVYMENQPGWLHNYTVTRARALLILLLSYLKGKLTTVIEQSLQDTRELGCDSSYTEVDVIVHQLDTKSFTFNDSDNDRHVSGCINNVLNSSYLLNTIDNTIKTLQYNQTPFKLVVPVDITVKMNVEKKYLLPCVVER